MKTVAIISLVSVIGLIYLSYSPSTVDADASFAHFTSLYSKNYLSLDEAEFRKDVFTDNMERYARWNAEEGNSVFGITKFADQTEEEMQERMGLREDLIEEYQVPLYSGKPLESKTTIDHTHLMPAAKDQGRCGSCWAFAATAAFEGRHAVKNNKWRAISFSDQQALDCSSPEHGCNGGFYTSTWKYLINEKFIRNWWYDYDSQNPEKGTCHDFWYWGVAKDKGTGYIAQDENAIYEELKNGPIAIAIDATGWGGYQGGIFKADRCGTDINHGVVVTGYDATRDCWIVRNSWGKDWGEKGYMCLEFGTNACNINRYAMYPKM